jgi:hypothetical protein
VAGAPPRTSTAATAGSANTTAVTPEASRASSAWPTRMPATSVIRFRCGKDRLVENAWGSPRGAQRADIEQLRNRLAFPG